MAIDFKTAIVEIQARKHTDLMEKSTRYVAKFEAEILAQIKASPLAGRWSRKLNNPEATSTTELKELYDFLVKHWINEGRTQMHIKFEPQTYMSGICRHAHIEFYVTS